MKHQFKQRKWEKLPLLSTRFKLNYWLLNKVGLVLFGLIVFLLGMLITVVLYEYVFHSS
ncbi:MAG: hypothetical protein ACKVJS_02195 [Flavobacteriales bacterium]|jgi:hypothetical protein